MPPPSHPYHHPLWRNKNAYKAFQETLRHFWEPDKKCRMFEEWRIWSYWYDILASNLV